MSDHNELESLPNLRAIMDGRVSGAACEWPLIRTELHLLCARLAEAEREKDESDGRAVRAEDEATALRADNARLTATNAMLVTENARLRGALEILCACNAKVRTPHLANGKVRPGEWVEAWETARAALSGGSNGR